MPRFREREVSSEQELALERGHLAMFEPGVVDRRVPPRHWKRDGAADSGHGWTLPVSDEALRVWAGRVGLDPQLVVRHEAERFRDGRRYGPPSTITFADAEASARGEWVSPRERRLGRSR